MVKEVKRKRGRPKNSETKHAGGRPKGSFKDFEKQKEEILKRLSKGEPLLLILSDKGMPSQTSFYSFLLNNKSFLKRYREAKQIQAHCYADKSLISVLSTHQRVKKRTAEKNEVQSAKNVADEYKFQAAKLLPKVYGNNVDENASDNNNISEIKINISKPKDIRVKATKSTKVTKKAKK